MDRGPVRDPVSYKEQAVDIDGTRKLNNWPQQPLPCKYYYYMSSGAEHSLQPVGLSHFCGIFVLGHLLFLLIHLK